MYVDFKFAYTIIALSSFVCPMNKIFSQSKDLIGLPGPIVFNKVSYILASSHETNHIYYIQEYLPAGDDFDKYTNMILVEVLRDSGELKKFVLKKAATIENRRRTDLIANYKLFEMPGSGEFILDFILSNKRNNEVEVIEWNCYRYKTILDARGRKAIALFGFSIRAYKDDAMEFMKKFKFTREELISQIAKFEFPNLTIPQE